MFFSFYIYIYRLWIHVETLIIELRIFLYTKLCWCHMIKYVLFFSSQYLSPIYLSRKADAYIWHIMTYDLWDR